MFSSTLCVIGVVILAFVELTLGQKFCHDCIPYNYCKEAKQLVDMNPSKTPEQLFQDTKCGTYNSKIMVCCSEFRIPNFLTRWNSENVEPKHSNIGLLPDSCGKISIDRIMGGVVATLYEFPWMVLIAYGENATFGCSGTLINSQYVLTAAHCVISKDIKGVRIGDYNLEQDFDCQGNICENFTQDREVETEIIHNKFDWSTFTNDIALLRLKIPVVLPLKNADTICLPTTTKMQKMSITNKLATVAGWGLAEHGNRFTVLRKVVIPVRPTDVCQDYYSHISDTEPIQICAGELKKDSCRGDSGGPLMIETVIKGQTKFVQFGIISSGSTRCGSYLPGIYTDVRKYMTWILDNIKA